MATTREEIRRWLEKGKADGATHMIVWCDTFDYSDFPQYVYDPEVVATIACNPPRMTRLMEVYKLDMDWDEQLAERRAYHF